MKMRHIVLWATTPLLFGSCVVPSYPVESYAGSLDKCLDIQGTYQNLYYRQPYRLGVLTWALLPKQFGKKAQENGFKYNIILEGKNIKPLKTWVTFRFLDNQNLEATVFNTDGQSFAMVFNMQKKEDELEWYEREGFVCNKHMWQRSYSTTSSAEGTRRKRRLFTEITKQDSDALKSVGKGDSWSGALGLYLPDNEGGGNAYYYRRVNLTVDDIRANNEKAQQAIKQYEAAEAEAARLRKELQDNKSPR